MAVTSEEERFRSFAERFVIARAGSFDADPNVEAEQSWACILRAKTVYKTIQQQSGEFAPKPETATQAAPQGGSMSGRFGNPGASPANMPIPAKRPLGAYSGSVQSLAKVVRDMLAQGVHTPTIASAHQHLSDLVRAEDNEMDKAAQPLITGGPTRQEIADAYQSGKKRPWWMP